MQLFDIQNKLAILVRSIGDSPIEIIPIAESGSARNYFRVITKKRNLIGTYSSNVAENNAFLTFCKHFHDMGLNVPEIYAINPERTCYLQSDFGDDNLFEHVQIALMANSNPSTSSEVLTSHNENVIQLYKKALSHLVKFQVLGHQGLDYSKAYPTECFDRQAILDDLNYFKYYFVKPHEEINFNETRLNCDFNAFADFVSQAPCDFFMYRDFQSRNIMVKDSNLYFIDFQGGRKGPVNYDVVSLIYQVKAQIPQEIRDQLVQYYKKELSRFIDPEVIQFDKYQSHFVYLRLMQVLGAYGFRGLLQKKTHFIESIPYALREIVTFSISRPLLAYPELQSIISQFYGLKQKYTQLLELSTNRLTVTINSFSFKKGYPSDYSRNGGFVFNCRALPNPGRIPEFATKTGRDFEVIDYLMAIPSVHVFLGHVKGIIEQIVDSYSKRHFSHLMVSFGCTGGQHRSVFFAQTIYEWLKSTFPDIHLKMNHIELNITEEYNP